MIPIRRLRNPVQVYAWGSRSAIPELLGHAPTGEPQAELWMGDHPRAPSEVETADGWCRLDRVVRQEGEALIGSAIGMTRDAPPQLPFLFKILAAETALSIQAHPDRAAAEAGYAREEAAGLPRDAEERSYRDRNDKPEILLALTPFRMLRGFRALDEMAGLLERSGLVDVVPAAATFVSATDRAHALRPFVRAMLRLDGRELERALDVVLEQSAEAGDDAVTREILRLADEHPGDRGVLGPLYLGLHELAPGEAVFTPPGVLHAYLGGLGVELMANSDNVLRAGLTGKHVDPAELERILRLEATPSGRLAPEEESVAGAVAVRRFRAPQAGLVLTELRVGDESVRVEGAGARIVLAVDGAARLCAAGLSDSPRSLELRRGESALVPASCPTVELTSAGEGTARLFVGEARTDEVRADEARTGDSRSDEL